MCNSSIIGLRVAGQISLTVTNVIFANCSTAIRIELNAALFASSVTFRGMTGGAVVVQNATDISIANCTFTENFGGPNSYGGAISASHASKLLVLGSVFASNIGSYGGAIYTANCLSVSVENSRGYNNSAINLGGFAYIVSVGWAEFDTVTVSNSSATAVYCIQTNFTSRSSNFENNAGGAICSDPDSQVVVILSNFTKNTALPEGTGGAILSRGPLTVNLSTFSDNSARQGGALYPYAELVIDSSIFNNNFATISGGALISDATTDLKVIRNTSFSGNSAIGGHGGAVYMSLGDLTCIASTFTNNTCSQDGGAVFFENLSVSLFGCTFLSNKAHYGGGFYLDRVVAAIRDSYVGENNASISGGGFYVNLANITASNTNVSGNQALTGGAGYTSASSLILAQVSFSSNVADNGGGLSLLDNPDNNMVGCTFFDNHVSANGGALLVTNSGLTSSHSTLFRNTANYGGAVFVQNSSVALNFCNITNNKASVHGGGCYVEASTSLQLEYTIVSQNVATEQGGGVYGAGSNIVVNQGEISENVAGSGGGIYAVYALSTVMDSVLVRKNKASEGMGGGMYCIGPTAVTWLRCSENAAADSGGCAAVASDVANFNSCQIWDNSAGMSGGAIAAITTAASFVLPVSVHVTNSTIFGNFAGNYGGGCYGKNVINFDIHGSTVLSDNSCKGNGGAIGAENSTFYVQDSILMNNSAMVSGGGLYFYESNAILQNATITNNSAGSNGGAVCGITSEMFANFTLFGNNNASYGGGLYMVKMNYSVVTNSSIIGNVALVGDSALELETGQQTVFVRDSLVTQKNGSGSSVFCCGGARLSSISKAMLCSYPACNGDCAEAKGCECPFALYIGPSRFQPVVPEFNSTCTCAEGSSGPLCLARDECLNQTICPQGAHCFDTQDSYLCVSCPNGTFYNSYGLCIDTCSVNNGGCDPHVSCEVQISENLSEIVCGSCPAGFRGSGYRSCQTLCGDGTCNADQGEDCVSCRKDCNSTSCGMCGDGVCDSTESCTTCYEDCLATCPVKQCTACSENGKCVNGICVCEGSWDGPECSESTVPIVINTNSSQPIADISTSHVQFSVGIRKLVEKNSQNELVSEIDLDSREHNFSRVQSNFSESSQNTQWVYSTVLSNYAIINITFVSFEDPLTTYTFGNVTTQFPAHTLKFSLWVSNWPFKNTHNTLLAVMETIATSSAPCVARIDSQSDSGGSIAWVKVTLNGFSAYGQFQPYSTIDGQPRKIRFELNTSDDTVSAILPHFWDAAEFDPSYSVLVDDTPPGKVDECGNPITGHSSHSVKKTVAIAVPVTIIGVAILAALVIFILKKRHENRLKTSWSNIHLKAQTPT